MCCIWSIDAFGLINSRFGSRHPKRQLALPTFAPP